MQGAEPLAPQDVHQPTNPQLTVVEVASRFEVAALDLTFVRQCTQGARGCRVGRVERRERRAGPAQGLVTDLARLLGFAAARVL